MLLKLWFKEIKINIDINIMSAFDFTENNILEDYYEILELDKTATIDVIRSNYLKLAKKYHPDKGGNSELFESISRAYECLSKKESRKNYDLEYNNNANESNVHTLNYFKNEYDKFTKTIKPITTEEKAKLENKFKLEQLKDNSYTNDEMNDRINNRETERTMNDIELQDETFKNLIDNNKMSFNELFDYMKMEENQLVKKFETTDLMPCNDLNYSVFGEMDTKISQSNCGKIFEMEHIKFDVNKKNNFDINNFNNWKSNIKEEKKITDNDITNFMEKRRLEEKELTDTINNNFKDYKIKSQIENYLSIKNGIDYDDIKDL